MSEPLDPVRLCCGRHHGGVTCPDGRVMCCLCFNRFEIADLNTTVGGLRENVCADCAAEEKAVMLKRGISE